MKHLAKAILPTILCAGMLSAEGPINDQAANNPRIEESLKILDRLSEDQISADAAWGDYTDLFKEVDHRHKLQLFINMLSNNQISRDGMAGYPICRNGALLNACSKALGIKVETLIRNFCTMRPSGNLDDNMVIFDARKLFQAFGTKELTSMAEQDAAR